MFQGSLGNKGRAYFKNTENKQTNLLQSITYRPSMLTYTYNLIYSKVEAEEAKINPGNLEKERNSFAKVFSI